MSRGQRLTYLAIAAVIAVVAVVVLSGSGGDDGAQPAPTAATATPTATATTEPQEASPAATETPDPTPTPRPQPPLIEPGKVAKLRFTQGETIRFRVRADAADEIHVHGYDRYVDVGPGRPRTVSFDADITGIFEIELHGTGEQIAQLRVDPK